MGKSFQTCQRANWLQGLERGLHELRCRDPSLVKQHGRRAALSLVVGLQVSGAISRNREATYKMKKTEKLEPCKLA